MTKFSVFDSDGFPMAHYDDAIHGVDNIPDAAVAITDAQHREFTGNQGRRALVNGVVVTKTPTVTAPTATERLDARLARDEWLNALVEYLGAEAGRTVEGVKSAMITKV